MKDNTADKSDNNHNAQIRTSTRNIKPSQRMRESKEWEENDIMTNPKPKPIPGFLGNVIGSSDDEDDDLFS